MRIARTCIALAAIAAAAACSATPDTRSDSSTGDDTSVHVTQQSTARVVDSILPVEEELRRFREGLVQPTTFEGSAPSREALVRRFVDRLAARDTAALRAMVLTRAEFAWLVYPGSSYTRPPYRTPPGLVWMQLEESGTKGLGRLLRERFAVKDHVGHSCNATPTVEGEAKLWRGCTARVTTASGDTVSGRLFGVIVEHGGRFKFASYDNDF